MRLTKIKVAGFKSFADPTSVGFPSNLTGVVGPNGCGKSNIIDAVRWVMGELSAKHLRGDSMTDVIFNGSASRKPVGTASVELVFDNADGKISGPYADYAEVSLKRQVSRDGSSNYFLNGARCRRKDITQLFLGTGLGSRSYAIIEQGMISRVIEAKADDMRMFVEEAAGISGLHARRHEAELRLRAAEQNLARLDDVIGQLAGQIEALKRQSRQAVRYRAVSTAIRKTEATLCHLRRSIASAEVSEAERAKDLSVRVVADATAAQADAAKNQAIAAASMPALAMWRLCLCRDTRARRRALSVRRADPRMSHSGSIAAPGCRRQLPSGRVAPLARNSPASRRSHSS